MSTVNHPSRPNADSTRDQWLKRLSSLVDTVQSWAADLDWSTRRIETRMDDSEIGSYMAPALLLQHETTRVLLEPIARSAPGAEGVVDLYVMPAYDDIASLYFCDGEWRLSHRVIPSLTGASIQDGQFVPLSKPAFQNVLEEMSRNVAHPA